MKIQKKKVVLALFVLIMIAYGFVFKKIHFSVGNGAFIFMNIFPVAAGLLFGMRGGFMAGIITIFYVIFLGSTVYLDFRIFAPTITVSGIVMLTIGSSVGRLRDLSKGIKQELHKRQEVEAELRKIQKELELRVKERTLSLEQATIELKEEINERKQAQKEKEIKIEQLQEALAEVKTLQGLLPICSSCKKVRDDSGYWQQIESYIGARSDAVFSHSICPECTEKLYGQEDWYYKIKT